jgi:hypothetical protein
MVALAFLAPVNHDESQYHAAMLLAVRGLPFRDFLYLQPPYQPILTAPLASYFAGYSFIAGRLANVAFGMGILLCAYWTQLRLGGRAAPALVTTALLWLCHTFGFSATMLRNDALPALLLALVMLIAAADSRRVHSLAPGAWLMGGALLGTATGIKISYGITAGALGAYPLVLALLGRVSWQRALVAATAIGVGMILSLAPLAWFRAMAPDAFDYGMFRYHATAPFAWYIASGQAAKLGLGAKLVDTLLTLVRGPALAALVIYVIARVHDWRSGARGGDFLILIDLLVLAGLAATVLPTPTHRQYAMPLLSPLFVGLGLIVDRNREGLRGLGRVARVALYVGAIVGIGQPLVLLVQGIGTPVRTGISTEREARWIGTRIPQTAHGSIATLSPELVVDSGRALDPAFAAGPFAYRTGDDVPADQQVRLHMVSPATLSRHFASAPPAAIITGYESEPLPGGLTLDDGLRNWARSHGYRKVDSPVGKAELWLPGAENQPA